MLIDLLKNNPESFYDSKVNVNINKLAESFYKSLKSLGCTSKYNVYVDPSNYKTHEDLTGFSVNIIFKDLFGDKRDLDYLIFVNSNKSLISLQIKDDSESVLSNDQRRNVRFIEPRDDLERVIRVVGNFNCKLNDYLSNEARKTGFKYSSQLFNIDSSKKPINQNSVYPELDEEVISEEVKPLFLRKIMD